MPLFIIGLTVLSGMLIVAVYNYFRGDPDDGQSPMRRERNGREHNENEKTEKRGESDNVLYFPTEDIEKEKNKRNL